MNSHCFYAVMGTEVTLLQAASRILSREEPEISAVATEGLVGVGVNVMTSAEVVRAEKTGRRRAYHGACGQNDADR